MTDDADAPPKPERTEILAGMQSAITLWTYEGNLIWAKFNAMLVANSIVIAVAAGSTVNSGLGGVPFVVPSAGMVLCACWWLLTVRGFENYRYWIELTKELEGHLHPSVDIARRGGHFAEGLTVSFASPGSEKVTLVMSRSARLVRARTAASAVIGVFATVNAILVVAAFV